jgi:divalent metal cation (Fe/Co/Zn/Cd) transporter
VAHGLLTNNESTARRIHLIQSLTIVWMLLEAAGSLSAALLAHSPALSAFGGDSLIELLSAGVVLWRFTTLGEQEQAEHRAARIAGMLLFVLGAYVAVVSIITVLGYNTPKPSLLGICVLIAASVIMPWLAFEKRKLSAATGSAALRADAAESGLCGYMAVIALAGLIVNSVWRLPWADPAAALAIIPFVLHEGREAIRGKGCRCSA